MFLFLSLLYLMQMGCVFICLFDQYFLSIYYVPPTGETDLVPLLLELTHSFAQETDGNKEVITNRESCMMEEQDAKLENN